MKIICQGYIASRRTVMASQADTQKPSRQISQKCRPAKKERSGVAGDTRLITTNGVPRVDSVPPETMIEAWSGVEWVKVQVAPLSSPGALYRVSLSDGSQLECTASHRWPVLGINNGELNRVAGQTTSGLQVGDTIVPFYLGLEDMGVDSLLPENKSQEQQTLALEAGTTLGTTLASKVSLKKGLPDDITEIAPTCLAHFVAGWANPKKEVSSDARKRSVTCRSFCGAWAST